MTAKIITIAFLFLMWLMFRQLIRSGIATTNSPFLFLLRYGDYKGGKKNG